MPRSRRLVPATAPYPRVLIAPDKFKGTLTAAAAALAIEKGVRRAWPGVKTTRLGLTDGGEGFVETMVRATGGRLVTTQSLDAAWRPCTAQWGVLGDGRTAVIGLANASGIAQLPANLRNPETTSNVGTGVLISEALTRGFREILIGLGGSATTEGGTSLAAVIGYRFLDRYGKEIPLDGRGLSLLARIVKPAKLPRTRFTVATDVDNPLYGRQGAARQFAAQKGASPKMIERLERGLRRLSRVAARDLGQDFALEPGAGAAGGCGFGLMAFFRAKRENGFQLISRVLRLKALIREHDLVITGEGCLDRTSLLGKAPAQIGELARELGRPAWAMCGRIDLPRGRSPFAQMGALADRDPLSELLESVSPAQHAANLERLAYDMALRHGHA